MRSRRIAVAIGAAVLALAFPTSTALAADATGCSGSIASMDETGAVLGTASAPGDGGTQADPLPIDVAGTVAWKGSTEATITNGTWSVAIMGVPALSGSFDNSDGATSSSGVQDLAELPSQLGWALQGAMVIPVSGSITGSGGSCTADGYITGTGSATSSPVFFAGAAFAFLGLMLALTMLLATKATGVAGATAAATPSAGQKV
jgi:hypothetical protein